MSAEIVKFPYSISRRALARKPRQSKNGMPEERAAKAAGAVLTGEGWEQIITGFTPEQQQAFMADVWKLLNRHFRKL